MKAVISRILSSFSGLQPALLGLLLLPIFGIILLFSFNVRANLERLETASSDNIQWGLSQIEVDALELVQAIKTAEVTDPPNLSMVRQRFDVFYSRVGLLRQGRVFSDFQAETEAATLLNNMQDYLDSHIPLIDGTDDALRAGLPDMSIRTQAIRDDVRALSLLGIRYFSAVSDGRRDQLYGTLQNLAVLTVGLIAILTLLVAILIRLFRSADASARISRQTQDRLETILSTSLDAVVVTNRAGRIVDYNGAAERVFGYPRDTAIGADMAALIIPDKYQADHKRGMVRHLETGATKMVGAGVVQMSAKRQGGEEFPIDLSLDLIDTAEGELFVGFIRDISDRLDAENALRTARDKAIAGEKAKAELLAVMSHEMRTPLNGMLGTLELIDPTELSPKYRDYMKIIHTSGEQLLGHVNDVLDVSRLDARKMALNCEAFDLIGLLQESIDALRPRARDNGNEIILSDMHPDLHRVWTDRARLRQILNNLLSNAIKFTRNGRIIVEAECHDGLKDVELRVIDTGIGIAEKDIDRVFADFVTIDTGYGRHNSGTGLGLGIARRIATVLGGEMGVESEPGDGSVFWARLPMALPDASTRTNTAATPVAPSVKSEESTGLTVLVVEDNETNRIVVREILRKLGHQVYEAHDGLQGVSIAGTRAFDIILMDISMPGMDGIEATTQIRAGHGPNAETPIIASTAHALPEELRRFRAAGLDDVIVKPVTRNRIAEAISKALGQDPPLHSTRARPPSTLAQRMSQTREDLGPDLYDRALAGFIQEMDGFLAQDLTDLSAVRDMAHQLVGSTALLGASDLTDQLRVVEQAAKSMEYGPTNTAVLDLQKKWDAVRANIATQQKSGSSQDAQ